MGRDPAFLFYSSDFLTGTMFMTDEQVGKYIRLLCSQHQHGHMTERDMLKICKTYDEDIFEKFEKDLDGKYYQHRLELEINKRIAYSDSRRKNRTVKDKDMSNMSESYDEHMENENENIKNKKSAERKRKTSIRPTVDEVRDYCNERNNSVEPERFMDYYDSIGWLVGKKPMKDWKASVRTWEQKNKNSGQQQSLSLTPQRSPTIANEQKGDWERFKERNL